MEIDIKNYIEDNVPELKGKLFPLFTTELDSLCATYLFTPIRSGHVAESQLEIKIIWSDYDETQDIKQKLIALLGFESDEPYRVYGSTRFYSVLSGGGILFNDAVQMYENTLFFTISHRRVN
ncbi:MAG: hypothetical protein ACOXZ0_08260 [Eubacteriales bacterium]|jgi:hypothetical protein